MSNASEVVPTASNRDPSAATPSIDPQLKHQLDKYHKRLVHDITTQDVTYPIDEYDCFCRNKLTEKCTHCEDDGLDGAMCTWVGSENCRHRYHGHCIRNWRAWCEGQNKEITCPHCRITWETKSKFVVLAEEREAKQKAYMEFKEKRRIKKERDRDPNLFGDGCSPYVEDEEDEEDGQELMEDFEDFQGAEDVQDENRGLGKGHEEVQDKVVDGW